MLPAVIDATAVRFLCFTLGAWLHQRDADAIAYLLEENRTLRAQLGRRPLRLNDDQRRRLAVLGHRLGRARLHSLASLVTPDTLLRFVPLGERHFRHTVSEFVTHYQCERPHQGCGNTLLEPRRSRQPCGRITRRPRLGGLLNFYARAA